MSKPSRTNLLGLVEALSILAKYQPDSPYNFQHDQMWVCDENIPLTNAERARLDELGFFTDEEAWSVFS